MPIKTQITITNKPKISPPSAPIVITRQIRTQLAHGRRSPPLGRRGHSPKARRLPELKPCMSRSRSASMRFTSAGSVRNEWCRQGRGTPPAATLGHWARSEVQTGPGRPPDRRGHTTLRAGRRRQRAGEHWRDSGHHCCVELNRERQANWRQTTAIQNKLYGNA